MQEIRRWSLWLQGIIKLLLAVGCVVFLVAEWDYLSGENLASVSPSLAFWDGRFTVVAFGIGLALSGAWDFWRASRLQPPDRPEDRAEVSAQALVVPEAISQSKPVIKPNPVQSEDMLFLSYSRRQFYFAESLVLHLQKRGIPVWFDVQQLVPGKHWHEDINMGLESSKGVILVASRAALASPYVQVEWEHALKHNQPVYVVAFEDVALPSTLKNAPVIDFRGHFDNALNRLIENLSGNKSYHDRIPQSNILGIPTKVPPAIHLLLLGLVLLIACSGITSLLAFTDFATNGMRDFPAMTFTLLLYRVSAIIIVPVLLLMGWRLLKREMTSSSQYVLGSLFSFIFSSYNVMTLITVFHIILLLSSNKPVNWGWLVFVVGWAGLLLVFAIGWLNTRYWRSADLLRWSTTGMVNQEYRLQVNAPLLDVQLDDIAKRSRQATYRLYYQPQDEALANKVRTGLQAAGYIPATQDAPADYPMVIVSNLTSKQQLHQLMDTFPSQLVCVLASNISLPKDLSSLSNYQWVDFRSRNMARLVSSLHYLEEARENRRAAFSLDLLPESLALPVFPQDTAQLLMVWRATAAYCIAVPIIATLTGYLLPSANVGGIIWWLPLLLCGVVMTVLGESLRRRIAGLRFAYFGMIGLSLLAALLPLIRGFNTRLVVSVALLLGYYFYTLPLLINAIRQGDVPSRSASPNVLGSARIHPAWLAQIAFVLILCAIMGVVFFVSGDGNLMLALAQRQYP